MYYDKIYIVISITKCGLIAILFTDWLTKKTTWRKPRFFGICMKNKMTIAYFANGPARCCFYVRF